MYLGGWRQEEAHLAPFFRLSRHHGHRHVQLGARAVAARDVAEQAAEPSRPCADLQTDIIHSNTVTTATRFTVSEQEVLQGDCTLHHITV